MPRLPHAFSAKCCTPLRIHHLKLVRAQEQGTQPTAPTVPTPRILTPRVITVDKNAAYPRAIADLKAAGVLPQHVELRQVKYLTNLMEQDHRFIQPFPNA
jgi:hypothetical protein